MEPKLKILMVVSECTPFAKTGGLADVAGALPKALASLGHDVRVILPYYTRKIDARQWGITRLPGALDVPMGGGETRHQLTAHLHETRLPGSQVPVYLVSQDAFFDREELYRTDEGDYEDNAARFGFFSKAALAACKHLEFQPDLVHCNDWHTALVPVYLKTLYSHDSFFSATATVFTIHNLAYQGLFSRAIMQATGLPDSTFSVDGLEFYGQVNFMKGGIIFADMVSTVSERYSQEIQTAEYGFGLEGILQRRSADLRGIVNGIDTGDWSPEGDAYLPLRYDRDHLEGKAEVKKRFLKELGLEPLEDHALVGMISRLDSQKGFDLLSEIIDYLMNLKIQFVILGTGDRKYHELLERIRSHYPDKASTHLVFSNELAHKIAAASDLFLMPSRYEPCGLNQIISLRYGTVPVVRATGGLADTVHEFDPSDESGNGFIFHEYNSMAFFNAIQRALEVYETRPDQWKGLMRRGMAEDHSWTASARRYEDLYRGALAKKIPGPGA